MFVGLGGGVKVFDGFLGFLICCGVGIICFLSGFRGLLTGGWVVLAMLGFSGFLVRGLFRGFLGLVLRCLVLTSVVWLVWVRRVLVIFLFWVQAQYACLISGFVLGVFLTFRFFGFSVVCFLYGFV